MYLDCSGDSTWLFIDRYKPLAWGFVIGSPASLTWDNLKKICMDWLREMLP
jgi:hypothetical protein